MITAGGRRASTAVPVRELLERVVAARGWQERLSQQRAVAVWNAVAGAELARHTVALGMQGRTLVVAVRDGTWATQLTFFCTDLLRRLQEQGVSGIRDIRFRVGFPAGVAPVWRNPPPVSADTGATPEDWASGRRLAERAAAGELSDALARMYVAAKARQRRLEGMMSERGSGHGDP